MLQSLVSALDMLYELPLQLLVELPQCLLPYTLSSIDLSRTKRCRPLTDGTNLIYTLPFHGYAMPLNCLCSALFPPVNINQDPPSLPSRLSVSCRIV